MPIETSEEEITQFFESTMCKAVDAHAKMKTGKLTCEELLEQSILYPIMKVTVEENNAVLKCDHQQIMTTMFYLQEHGVKKEINNIAQILYLLPLGDYDGDIEESLEQLSASFRFPSDFMQKVKLAAGIVESILNFEHVGDGYMIEWLAEVQPWNLCPEMLSTAIAAAWFITQFDSRIYGVVQVECFYQAMCECFIGKDKDVDIDDLVKRNFSEKMLDYIGANANIDHETVKHINVAVDLPYPADRPVH